MDCYQEATAELQDHPLRRWLKKRGWDFYPHQLETLEATLAGRDTLVIAPTGAGKTLASFLPALFDLTRQRGRLDREKEAKKELGAAFRPQLHTLYISPLKALTVDIERNLLVPIKEEKLPITVETRTGDTSAYRRKIQRTRPPHCLMTTPESLALMLSYEGSAEYFASLRYVIIDELHALMHSKRGDLLSLNLQRLRTFAPEAVRIGLSATLSDPVGAEHYLSQHHETRRVTVKGGAQPEISILLGAQRMPWRGHSGSYVIPELYQEVERATMSVVFVNTRAQAELIYQALHEWNEDRLELALHHGSLEREGRLLVESQMASGTVDCVVATSSLDLGLDFAKVDLIIQVGAPKGVSRLLQRVGRSNHQLEVPSRAVLVPANRFEYLECLAAKESIADRELDGVAPKEGGYDVLAQHLTGVACAGPFEAEALYQEVLCAWPYRTLAREQFEKLLTFVQNGGYALRQYDRFARLVPVEGRPGWYEIAGKRFIQQYRMNLGTIVEAAMLKVKLRQRTLGQIEEWFVQNLVPGDTFLFAGRVLRFKGASSEGVQVEATKDRSPKIPSYNGGRMPLSTHLSARVRSMLSAPSAWQDFPEQVSSWLEEQRARSVLPDPKGVLIESFTRRRTETVGKTGQRTSQRHYLVLYTFEGRNANQTLGFLLCKRLDQLGYKPLGFVATDYALTIWGLRVVGDLTQILTPDLMEIELPEWLGETTLIKRNFREVSLISGLIERRSPGKEKSGKQVLFNTDLIYDVLKEYEPDHILLQAARQDAMTGTIDLGRVTSFLARIQGRIHHEVLEKVSPLAIPMILEVSRESLDRDVTDHYLLEELEEQLLEEVGLV